MGNERGDVGLKILADNGGLWLFSRDRFGTQPQPPPSFKKNQRFCASLSIPAIVVRLLWERAMFVRAERIHANIYHEEERTC
jgi:hypothetical protein